MTRLPAKYQWKRMVLKVGSSLISDSDNGLSTTHLLGMAKFIADSRAEGKEIILVSSGSVAAGITAQQKIEHHKSRSLAHKQALAAIGQPLVIGHWQRLFNFHCAQVLLTFADLENRQRYVNAKNTLLELLKMNVLPIINENDSVAHEELKVGDNDNLAAYVASLIDADIFVICSDVDGLYDANPLQFADANLLTEVKVISEEIMNFATSTNNPIATGGMLTKLQAAEKATSRGINTLIVNGKKSQTFSDLAHQKQVGTFFPRKLLPVAAKKQWIKHLCKPKGIIYVDNGAVSALTMQGASLLAKGILAVDGLFNVGDVVEILESSSHKKIALGICQYHAQDLNAIKQHHSNEFEKILGFISSEEVIHRNDLILIKQD